jgi:hypothetical protein
MWILRWALIWRRPRYVSYFYTNLKLLYWFSLYRRYSLCRWITLCPLYFIITHTIMWRLGQCSQYSYSLQAGWFGVRTVVGARGVPFPTPVHSGPCVHSGSCMMGTWLFPRITWWGVALTTRSHQELRLGMRRAMPPLLSVPAWLVTRRMVYCTMKLCSCQHCAFV